VREPALVESSGLAASHAHPGVYYAHNDSGDSARFFALTESGEALGEFDLPGATAVDWEDVAVGPCPAGWCVYLGDIGDNAMARAEYALYRVAEPDVAVDRPAGAVEVAFERVPFVYPDGPHNAETLLVHPQTGDVYVVTKVMSGASVVYRAAAPLAPDRRVTLARVADLPLPTGSLATAGDVHPCAPRVLLRTYNDLFEYRAAPGAPFESVFAATPVRVPAAGEIQGEAVAYRLDGHGYLTTSEGRMPPIQRADCP
jgi:hypothetical protein